MTENLDKKTGRSTDAFCRTFRIKKNRRPVYNFHRLSSILTRLIQNKYSIQIEHGIKFVFTKIRFSSGISLVDDEKLFIQFRDGSKIKNPILELNNTNTDRLISPTDCYTQCIKNLNCNSFTFCKHRSYKIDISCLLSDLVLIDKKDNQAEDLFEKSFDIANDKLKGELEKDNFCQTYGINYLQHFNAKGNWMLATSSSLKSEFFDSPEECARNCYDYNKNEFFKCGKLEICLDDRKESKKFQCNLKPFSSLDEIQLKNKSCKYFKIDNLVNFHQIELDETGPLKLNSVGETIDKCARSCSKVDDCKKFNFCYDKNFDKENVKSEIGYCLTFEKSDSSFDAEKKALDCVTMMKNDNVYFKDESDSAEERYRYVNETDTTQLRRAMFALFIFVAGTLGLILGFVGFCYYESSILPAYQAEKGSYFPTRLARLGICKTNDNDSDETINVENVKTVEPVSDYEEIRDEPIVLTINDKRKSTKINESEFMDIKL